MAYVQETYTLPSNGMIEGIPKQVTLRNITTAEEKLLLGSTEDALDDVLKACIVEPKNIDLSKMISADKHFIMYKLRIISYGPGYHVSVKCPHCGKETEFKINLDELETDFLPDDFSEPYAERKLPVAGDTVSFKLPRHADTEKARRDARKYARKFPAAKGDMLYIYNLLTNIHQVNDKDLTLREKQAWLEGLSGMDSSFIKNELEKLKVGLDTTCIEDCPVCKGEIEFNIPITSEFFRTRFDD